jgi:long-chain acyl-CoA synthetase
VSSDDPMTKGIHMRDWLLIVSHIFERISIFNTLSLSGSIAFTKNSTDSNYLFDDLIEVKPTVLSTIPKVLENIIDKVWKEGTENGFGSNLHWSLFGLGEAGRGGIESLRSALIKAAVSSKVTLISRFPNSTVSPIWDTILREIKNSILPRIKLIISGSSPLDPRIRDLAKALFSVNVIEGYGMTETGGLIAVGSTDDVKWDGGWGMTGTVVAGTEIKVSFS